MTLIVEQNAFRTMLQHAEREQPREAVGLLAGRPHGVVSLALPLVNVAGAGAFLADPHVQYLAERRIAASGLRLLAIYHSHPGGGAQLSALDRHFGRRHDVAHIVIALAHGDCPLDVKAYRLRGGETVPVPLRI